MLLLDKLPYFAKKKSFFYLILQKTDRRITLFYSKKTILYHLIISLYSEERQRTCANRFRYFYDRKYPRVIDKA